MVQIRIVALLSIMIATVGNAQNEFLPECFEEKRLLAEFDSSWRQQNQLALKHFVPEAGPFSKIYSEWQLRKILKLLPEISLRIACDSIAEVNMLYVERNHDDHYREDVVIGIEYKDSRRTVDYYKWYSGERSIAYIGRSTGGDVVQSIALELESMTYNISPYVDFAIILSIRKDTWNYYRGNQRILRNSYLAIIYQALELIEQ